MNWRQATRRRHAPGMEKRKMCHVGRHSDWHDGTVLPPQYISYGRCCSGSGGRQENSQIYVFVPIAVETMGTINSDGLEFLGDLGRPQVTDDIHESPSCSNACQFLFSATVRSPSRALSPTQPLRTNFRLFQLLFFNPWDLYYWGY